MVRKITILGGGNGGHAAACDLTAKGHEVTLYEDERFIPHMQSVFETKKISYKGAIGTETAEIANVTCDLAEAVRGADTVLVMVPAFVHSSLAKKLAPVIREGQYVFVLPGTFGSLTFYREFRKAGKDITVGESHTLPYAVRLTGDGEVLVMSRFDPLKVGIMPADRTEEAVKVIADLFPGVTAVKSVIACGLSSLNPIIHVPGCILNAGRIEYAGQPFYYYTEGFSDCVARATEQLDRERCAILEALGYESDIVAHEIGSVIRTDDVKEAVAGNPSFAKIAVPPTFNYRYYTEDIPFGLAVWAKLARQIGVKTPIMDSMVTLGSCIMQKDCWSCGRELSDFGIEDMGRDELLEFLQNGA
ncbi:MAG: NAD/NADP octopine/nopaline dehydrogenase family protein [Solobacterium sp.]|nr:NAD/NADP octopine/nopaline dehydrogenase family protein [Solobacterium sp.]